MTTIAYAGGIMAADSRCTDEFGAVATRIQKIYRLQNKAILGVAGDADVRDICDLLGKSTLKRLPTRKELRDLEIDFAGILVFQTGSIFFVEAGRIDDGAGYWFGSIVECKERFASVGSGCQFAIGAMAAGKGARAAIEIAAKFDTASGLPIIEMPLKVEVKTKSTELEVAPVKPKKAKRKS